MRREIEFLLKMDGFNAYQGFQDLQKNIFLNDDLDMRFTKNDFIDLFACILLYHQIIENMMKSLLVNYNYYNEFRNYPKKVTKIKIPNGYAKKMNLIKKFRSDFQFDSVIEFTDKCFWFNKIRNQLAHCATHIEQKDIVDKMNKAKEVYHRIRDIYIDISFSIVEKIKKGTKNFTEFLVPVENFLDDRKALGSYICENFEILDRHFNSIAVSIYIHLYNEEHKREKLDEDYFWGLMEFENIEKKEALIFLHILE